MAAPTFIRSPKILTILGSANDVITLELYIWNDPSLIPATPNYTLVKNVPTTAIGQVSFNVSGYCREFIDFSTYSEITSDTAVNVDEYCYCTIKQYRDGKIEATTELICFDGFGYHSKGVNPYYSELYMDAGNYYIKDSGNTGGVTYYDNQAFTWEAKYTGLISGGITTITLANVVGRLPYRHPSYLGEGNKLEIIKNSVVQATYYFYEQAECKYTTINCDFVNKQGVWQRIVFFKASSSNFSMTNTEYDLKPSNLDYNLGKNVRQTFNTNGTETITCNTGWVYEAYSDVIKQLLLSEEIRLDDIPVNINSKSTKLQKNINDKNINYEVTFQYSAPTLQYNI